MYDRAWLSHLQIDQNSQGRWHLSWPDGSPAMFGETYKRAQDAKRARTLLLKNI